jgi:hypothetical protein
MSAATKKVLERWLRKANIDLKRVTAMCGSIVGSLHPEATTSHARRTLRWAPLDNRDDKHLEAVMRAVEQ